MASYDGAFVGNTTRGGSISLQLCCVKLPQKIHATFDSHCVVVNKVIQRSIPVKLGGYGEGAVPSWGIPIVGSGDVCVRQ